MSDERILRLSAVVYHADPIPGGEDLSEIVEETRRLFAQGAVTVIWDCSACASFAGDLALLCGAAAEAFHYADGARATFRMVEVPDLWYEDLRLNGLTDIIDIRPRSGR